jgi:hypothetical protein
MVAILNQKWPPKYKNPPIWAKFGFQVDFNHSKPKWSPYGVACLTPCKDPFTLKSVHFLIFILATNHFENFKNKEHNFEEPYYDP